MSKYRITFEKSGKSVYISHLDLRRTFQRTFKRAEINVKHTEGFNPHAHISIALPLSLGAESVCELLDFETLDNLRADAKDALNAALPEGIKVLEINEGGRKVGEIAWLSCELRLTYDAGVPDGAETALSELFASDSVVIRKKSKKGEIDFDISPCLNALKITREAGTRLLLTAITAAQNPSLNPMHLVDAVKRYRPELTPDFAAVKRLELFDSEFKPFK